MESDGVVLRRAERVMSDNTTIYVIITLLTPQIYDLKQRH